MSRPRAVVTDADYPDLEIERAVLEPAGIGLELAQVKDGAPLREAVRLADGVIVQYARLTRDVLAQMERCRVIARYGVGLDTIDLDAARERGIPVRNVPDYCTDEVADHTLALMLAVLRGVHVLARDVEAGRWRLDVARPLHRIRGLTLGLIGCGRIGRAVAERARPFGMRVLGHDPFVDDATLAQHGIEPTSLEGVLRRADVLSLHRPGSLDAPPVLGRAELALVKRGVVLVNTARGSLLDEAALREALADGRVRGAALDVLATEPPGAVSLVGLPNVVVTPHAAWYSEESQVALRRSVAEIVRDAILEARNT